MNKNMLCSAIGIIGAAIAEFLGGWDSAVITLIIFMAVDYISGLVVAGVFQKSPKSENGGLESKAGFKGLCRKCMIVLFVLIGNHLDLMIGVDYVRNAIIIGFNVRPDAMAKATSEREGVDVRLYKVIYQAIEDIEAAMKGMLDPVYEEKVIGHAEVRQIFKASAVGNIAGSYVLDGMFQRGCSVRIKREGKQIFEGPLASLKRFKDDVKEVKAGYECGFVFERFNDIKEGDIFEAYIVEEYRDDN